jgi:hypothetical protein
MKRNNILIGLIVLIGIGFLVWQLCQRVLAPSQASSTNKTNGSQFHTNAIGETTEPKATTKESTTLPTPKPSIPAAVMEYVQNIKADPAYDWKQPINFYGRVVDESNEPVAGATVSFEWNDLSPTGTSRDSTTSDSNGSFSLTNRRGKRLYVDVGKEGYYSSGNARGAAFEYANPADGLFTPDPGNPVVFHLLKKGIGADLITSQYGMKPYFGVTVPLDGTPVQVDLLERQTGQGPMTISQVKPEFSNWKQATNWSFRMEIPDGGFIEQTDEFPFTAPEEGYQPIVEFNFQQGQSDWIENLKKDYYIKFSNPPRYGWLKLDTSIMMEGARLTYAINPSGSRNLEPK